MFRPLPLIGQFAVYALFALLIGFFSTNPAYTYVDPGMAVIKLSFNHAGARKGECRQLSAEELAALAPNMRLPMDCPRERVPLHIELQLDGALLYQSFVPPSGLARDGPATVYERFVVKPGQHEITAYLRDSRRSEGFDYEARAQVELLPQQNFTVDFRADTGGFIFK
jgi:hypothetical protein